MNTISRREMMKGSATIGFLYFVTRFLATLGLGAVAVMTNICNFSSSKLVSWTVEIVNALQRMSPILESLGVPNIVKLVADAVVVANDLKAAFANNLQMDFVTLFDKLSGLVEQIASDIGLINIASRVPLEAILALVSIAMHLVADHLQKTVVLAGAAEQVNKTIEAQPAQAQPALQQAVLTITRHATTQPWGLAFKH